MEVAQVPVVKNFSIVYIKGYGRAEVLGVNKGGVVVQMVSGKYKSCVFTARFQDVRP